MRVPRFLTGRTARSLALVGLVGMTAMGYQQSAKWLDAARDDVVWLAPAGPCALGKAPCTFSHSNVALSVESSVSQFQPDTPFELEVVFADGAPDAAWVQLEGVDMFMGISRYALQSHDDGHYRLSLRLPSCSVDSMTWRGHVMAQVGEQTYGTRFEFDSVTP